MVSEETVTYVEMTSREQLRPGRPAPGVTLEAVPLDSPLIRPTVVRVGLPYQWAGVTRDDAEWERWLGDDRRRQWLVRRGDEVAGVCEVEVHPGDEVEIATFGLLPECVGAGIGGHALTLATRAAWDLDHPDLGAVRRVWLHTSTLDHPNALANYRSRGFRPFRTVVRRHD